MKRGRFFQKITLVTLLGVALVFAPPVRWAKADIFDGAFGAISSGLDYIWPDDRDIKDFSFRMGMGLGAMPDYIGSDDYRLRLVPLIDVRFRDRWVLQGTKFRVNILNHKVFKAGPLVKYKFGRKESRNPLLAGMGDINNTLQVGAFIDVQTELVIANLEYRKALGAGQGSEVLMLLAHGLYRQDDWLVVAGWRARWRSGRNMMTNFGINDAQAQATGLDVYIPKSGFAQSELNIVTRYQVNDLLRVEALVGGGLVLGSAADSPLVKGNGSAFQAIAGVGFRYSF